MIEIEAIAEFVATNKEFIICAAFVTSLVITLIAIPSIIKVAEIKNLYDEPNKRGAHTSLIPTLGGLAIFAGVIFSITFWSSMYSFPELKYVISAIIIIFFVSIKDDIIALDPIKKIGAQLIAAFIIIFWGNIRLTSLYGIFGITDLPYWTSIALTLITLIVITNSFNLIDGIDGLAGAIGIVVSAAFGCCFYVIHEYGLAILAFSLAGTLIGFIRYNLTPAKIFMGDTGSLLIGLISAVLAIKFIEINKVTQFVLSGPAIAFGILVVPLFDTLRVFLLRILSGHSPFKPDQKHVHHVLLSLGVSHLQATLILVGINLFFIFIIKSTQSTISKTKTNKSRILKLCIVPVIKVFKTGFNVFNISK